MKSYRKEFLVRVVLTPGIGYENTAAPYRSTLRYAITRAVEKSLNPGDFIKGKVASIKPVARK